MCFVELTLIQSIIAGELLDVCAINDNGDTIIIKASIAVTPHLALSYLATELSNKQSGSVIFRLIRPIKLWYN